MSIAGELPKCPVCDGAPKAQPYYEEQDWLVLRCSACTYAWVVDIRNPPETTAFDWSENIVSESQRRMSMYRDRLDRAQRYDPTPATWLDVGCGGGGMLSCVAQAGYDAEGIELSPSADVIRQQLGIPVHRKALRDAKADLLHSEYGVISYFHVLEHVTDTKAELEAARRLLSPTGLLIVEVPYFDSLPWKVFGTRHRHFYRGHRSYFNERSLRTLLENAGFRVVESRSVPYKMTMDWLAWRLGGPTLRRLLPGFLARRVLAINSGEYLLVLAQHGEMKGQSTVPGRESFGSR